MKALKIIQGGGHYGDLDLAGTRRDSRNKDTALYVNLREGEVAEFGDIKTRDVFNPIIIAGRGKVVAHSVDNQRFGGDGIQARTSHIHIAYTNVEQVTPTRPYKVCERQGNETIEQCLARNNETVFDPSLLEWERHPSYAGEIIPSCHVDAVIQLYATQSDGYTLNPGGIITDIRMPHVRARIDDLKVQAIMGSENNDYADIHIGTETLDLKMPYMMPVVFNTLRDSKLGCEHARVPEGACVKVIEVKPRPDSIPVDEIRTRDNEIQGFASQCVIEKCKGSGSRGGGNVMSDDSHAGDPLVYLESLKNLKAPALTEQDFKDAAAETVLSVRMIKTVARVESRGLSFLPTGYTTSLLERHKVYKFAKSKGVDVRHAMDCLGTNVINRKAGGYQGKEAEWSRCKTACLVGDPEFNKPNHIGLEIALLSMSFGMFQIMGFNYRTCGYSSVFEMVEAFHESEGNQLKAFCRFMIANDLVKHLKEAERLIEAGKVPRPAFAEFAKGYNGPQYQKNQYDVKLARAYRDLEPDQPIPTTPVEEPKPLHQSGTMQGAVTAVLGGGTGVVTAVTQLSDALGSGADKATDAIERVKDAGSKLQGAAEAVDVGLFASLPVLPVWAPWALMLVLTAVVTIAGSRAAQRRRHDHLTGKNRN